MFISALARTMDILPKSIAILTYDSMEFIVIFEKHVSVITALAHTMRFRETRFIF